MIRLTYNVTTDREMTPQEVADLLQVKSLEDGPHIPVGLGFFEGRVDILHPNKFNIYYTVAKAPSRIHIIELELLVEGISQAIHDLLDFEDIQIEEVLEVV